MSALRVLYWVFNYMPEWEAVSKEIVSLRQGLDGTIDGSVMSLNTKTRGLSLGGRDKRIPLPHGLPLFPLLKPYASGFDVNHLFASAGERFLTSALSRHNGVLTVAKDTTILRGFERNLDAFGRLRAIVAQSERDREILRQLGVRDERLWLIRPGIPTAPYREATGRFTILFASSPLSAEDFLSRGIYLIIRVAASMPDIQFLLVWRKRHLGKLERLIAGTGVTNVEIANGMISDMGAMYDRVHATILPGLEHRSFIPCPRSGLESLAHGKPLLVSHFVSLAETVASSRAGVVFEPSGAGLMAAIRQLRDDYSAYQANTQRYVVENFSPTTHLSLYRRLYENTAG